MSNGNEGVAGKMLLLCDRDGTVLTDDDGALAAWLEMNNGNLLEVCYAPGNYPALTVAETSISREKLTEHIRARCEDWHIDKNNLRLDILSDDEDVGPGYVGGPREPVAT